MFELGVRPKLRFWAKMSRKQTPKTGSRNSASELTNPLEMVKKNMLVTGIAKS